MDKIFLFNFQFKTLWNGVHVCVSVVKESGMILYPGTTGSCNHLPGTDVDIVTVEYRHP